MLGRSSLSRLPLIIAASVVVAVVLTSCTTSPASDHAPAASTALGPSQSAQPPVSKGNGLHVQGNEIVNGRGQVIRLVGFNMSGSEYACVEGWGIFDAPDDLNISASVVAAMASWTGANAVRVPLNEQCWLGLGVPAQYGGEAYQKAIKRFVGLLNSRGFVAVLDLHRSAPGTTKSLDQEQMPDRDHSVEFWRQVAATFKGYDSVVFDLFNEPAPFGEADSARAWACWRDGGCTLQSQNGGPTYVAAGMNDLIRAVRQAGSSNIVLAGGIYWAEELHRWLEYEPLDPLHNMAASFHDYSYNSRCAQLSCYETDLAKVAEHVPLFVGEAGPDLTIGYDQAHDHCPASAVGQTGFDKALFDWLDEHGASYTAWTWNTWTSCWSLISDWSGTPTKPWGEFIRARLAAGGAHAPQ